MTLSAEILRFLREERGTAAIEFAFVAWPLMLLLFGSIEVSRLVWVRTALQETAISGARCMGIRAADCASADVFSASETKDFIRGAARAWGLSLAPTDITLEPSAGCGETAGYSGVLIDYRFNSPLTLLSGPRLSFEACFPNQV